MSPRFDHAPALHHVDAVAGFDGREAVRDDQERTVQAVERLLNERLAPGVERARREAFELGI